MRQSESDTDGGSGAGFLKHIPAMIRQRRWTLILPVVAGLGLGVAASFLLPTVYQSKALLLVEAPQLPEDVAGAVSTDVVDQRIARIRQQVLSRPGLIELIEKYGLYQDRRDSESLSEIIETMREAVAIEPVSAEIQRKGGSNSTTIAFALQFAYQDAGRAQAVAQDLTQRVLLIDSTRNAEQAANTVQFLTDQSEGLRTQIASLEQQIAQTKASNGQVLSNANVTLLGGNSGNYDAQIAALQRENAQLNAQRAATRTSANRDPAVTAVETQLAATRAVFAESHPDVVMLRQQLAEAKELAARNVERLPVDTIESQLTFNNSQIAALQSARSQETARVSSTLASQARAPLVLEQIAQLQQRLAALNTQNQTVSERLMAAVAGAKADTERKGERLSVIDPPVVPEEPLSPNRPLLILAGAAGGLALGLLLIFLIEMFTRPIRDLDAITAATGEPPLGVMPVIATPKAAGRQRISRLWRRPSRA